MMNDNHSLKPPRGLKNASEFQLVTYARRGEATAFEALYELHSQRVYFFCLNIAARKEAQELTRDIFLKVFRSISTFKRDSEFARALDELMLQTAVNVRERQERVATASACLAAGLSTANAKLTTN